MADLYSAETTGYEATPYVKPNTAGFGARFKRFQATINMASITVTTADNVLLAKVPAGHKFAFGVITTSATLGTSVVAIGTNKTHGSNGQLRAAAVFTTTDTPTFFGLASAVGGATLTADTPIYLTAATANLPTSGTLVIDLYYTLAH